MLKIQSHEGKIKAEMRGTTQEICAEVAAVIYEITKQTTRPYEGNSTEANRAQDVPCCYQLCDRRSERGSDKR